MNYLSARAIPFIFIIDYDCSAPLIFPMRCIDGSRQYEILHTDASYSSSSGINSNDIIFEINGITNNTKYQPVEKVITLKKEAVQYSRYKKAFDYIIENQRIGNSYLANLTFPTKLITDTTLDELYNVSIAKYKLLVKNKFVVFSPETFITIKNGLIMTRPMKGTITSEIPNAAEIIMQNEKEFAEHMTVVDLLRNDLNMVAENVRVEKFRYIDEIKTSSKNLLQVSSLITGDLKNEYKCCLGDMFQKLLPAGSVTGAPKRKTVEIINQAEGYDRGYYTGVFGIFDGQNLDSGVMIRFVEKFEDELYFKSGGGITVYSEPEKEYQELLDKVYVPVG